MSTEQGLSPLALAYLEHIKEIRWGEKALEADITPIMSRLLRRVRQDNEQNFDFNGRRLKRTWKITSRMNLVLRLHWTVETDWPVLSLNHEKGIDTPTELKYVFTDRALGSNRLPSVNEGNLLSSAVDECSRLWTLGVEHVKTLLNDRSFRALKTGVLLLDTLVQRFPDALVDIGVPKEVAEQAAKVGRESDWPLYIQWDVKQALIDKEVLMDIIFYPYTGNESDKAPSNLKLVIYNGAELGDLLQNLEKGSYRRHPVVADWTDRLMKIVDGSSSLEAVAEEVVRDTASIVKKVMDRLAKQRMANT